MKFREFLLEIFDKPWTKTLDPEKSKKAEEILKNSPIHKNDTIDKVKIYHLENGESMISYIRNGSLEVHHHDKEGVSGAFDPHRKTPNPRFVATMKKHLEEEGIDKGIGIRLLAKDNKMADRYLGLAKRIARKSKHNLIVSHQKEKIGDGEIHKIEVHHITPGQEGISEMFKQDGNPDVKCYYGDNLK